MQVSGSKWKKINLDASPAGEQFLIFLFFNRTLFRNIIASLQTEIQNFYLKSSEMFESEVYQNCYLIKSLSKGSFSFFWGLFFVLFFRKFDFCRKLIKKFRYKQNWMIASNLRLVGLSLQHIDPYNMLHSDWLKYCSENVLGIDFELKYKV